MSKRLSLIEASTNVRAMALLIAAGLVCVMLFTSSLCFAVEAHKLPDNLNAIQLGEVKFPYGVIWTAKAFGSVRYRAGRAPTLMIDQQKHIQGFGGCNTYTSTVVINKTQELAIGPILFTKNICTPETLAQEREFLMGLRNATRWEVQSDKFILKTREGDIIFIRTL